jgi:myo-inositol-1(or 4)-monophosphatase
MVTMPATADLKRLENIVVAAASDILVPDFGRSEFHYKPDGSVITPADVAMQQRLQSELAEAWPAYAMLGEEMSDAQQRAAMAEAKGYWCIDPLDGTNNFASGMPFFAVSVALVIDGLQQLGLIYDPLRNEVFSALRNGGAFLNGKALRVPDSKPFVENVIAEIDMKRLPKDLAVRLVTEEPFSSQRNIGSSALDWCWLAAGRYNVYLHGGQMMWDYAAGSLIFQEAGGYSKSLDGEAVFRGELEVRSVLASADAGLFDYWEKWVGIPL